MSATTEFFEKLQEDKDSTIDLFKMEMERATKIDKLRTDGKTFQQAVKEIDDPRQLSSIQKAYLVKEQDTIFIQGELVTNKKGLLVAKTDSPLNMQILIKKVCELRPCMNELKGIVMIDEGTRSTIDDLMGTMPKNGPIKARPATDGDLYKIANEAKNYGLNWSDKHIFQVFHQMAIKDSYHPFKCFVESKEWDGIDRFAQLNDTITIKSDFKEHGETYKLYTHRWLIGSVAKVYIPGSQNTVLTLHGDQGVGKSRWIRKLQPVDGCYGEGLLDPNSKDHILKHLDYMLYHASELDGTTRKSDISAIKDYFTKEDISERPAYGRLNRSGKSVCSFAASVNDGQFLNDITGSRRYLIIPVDKLDHNHTVDMQQVYAQAKVLLDKGERWWFDDAEIVSINEINTSFTIENHIDTMASKVKAGTIEKPLSEIYSLFSEKQPSHSELTKLGSLLKKKGLSHRRGMVEGVKLTLYSIALPEATIHFS